MSSEPPASPSSVNAWLSAQATYPVLFVIFIGVFGGLHPSAERIDERVLAGALLVALVNLPWCFVLLRRLRRPGPRGPFLRGTAGLVARLVFAVWVLDSIAANGHGAARRGYHQRQLRARATRDASPMRPPSPSPDASR